MRLLFNYKKEVLILNQYYKMYKKIYMKRGVSITCSWKCFSNSKKQRELEGNRHLATQ
jgi:hypothetical protein